jgi:hypothetical protein
MPYDTSVLDKAIAERRARWERERQITLTQVLQLLDEYGPRFSLREAYVFGSVTGAGRFDARSDVDIAIGRIPVASFFEMMTTLSLELGRDVDLVELDKCHFAHRIREKGVRWTASTARLNSGLTEWFRDDLSGRLSRRP